MFACMPNIGNMCGHYHFRDLINSWLVAHIRPLILCSIFHLNMMIHCQHTIKGNNEIYLYADNHSAQVIKNHIENELPFYFWNNRHKSNRLSISISLNSLNQIIVIYKPNLVDNTDRLYTSHKNKRVFGLYSFYLKNINE